MKTNTATVARTVGWTLLLSTILCSTSAMAEEATSPETDEAPAFLVATAEIGFIGGIGPVFDVDAGATVELNVWDNLYVGVTGSFNIRDSAMDLGNVAHGYMLSFVGPIVRYRARVAPHVQIAPFVGVVGVAQMEILDFEWGEIEESDPLAFHGGVQLAFTFGDFLIGAEADVTPVGTTMRSRNTDELRDEIAAPVALTLVIGGAF